MKVKCIYDKYPAMCITKNKIYNVHLDNELFPYIINDAGYVYLIGGDDGEFEVIYEEQKASQKTLRDEFAMAAMIGDWASQDTEYEGIFCERVVDQGALQDNAKLYYRMADAMLIAREEND